jgi:ribosomal protein L24E
MTRVPLPRPRPRRTDWVRTTCSFSPTKPNPAARRVFVRLDGRTVATLRGSRSV